MAGENRSRGASERTRVRERRVPPTRDMSQVRENRAAAPTREAIFDARGRARHAADGPPGDRGDDREQGPEDKAWDHGRQIRERSRGHRHRSDATQARARVSRRRDRLLFDLEERAA